MTTTFAPATSYAAGSGPESVTTADVNGDGKLDLVVADIGGGVDVLLGNGSGGFSAATSYAAGSGPASVTTVDVNHDGKLDLVVADALGGVDVLLGNGAGGFSAATSYAAGSSPEAATTADVNGDGKPDIVVVNYNGSVDVLLGNGAGSFSAATSYAVGSDATSVTTADVNRDGKLDVVVTSDDGVDVLLGNGAGGFSAATSDAAGSSPSSVTTADVNGDGNLDLVVADYGGNTVSVLLGNGSGGFAAPTSFPAGSEPLSVTTPDVNGDGNLDVVVADRRGGVDVLLGDGAGNFSAPTSYAVGSGSTSATTADVNGDGNLDLVVAVYRGDVDVLLGEVALTVTSVAASPPGGADLDAGKVVTFTIGTSEAATATGSTLTLSNGATATYVSGNGTPGHLLTYSYTVASTDTSTADLQATALNGTITDGAGRALSGFTAIDSQDRIDTVAPTVTGVTASPANGTYGAGAVVTFDVALSEIVSVSGGVPTLTLNDGGTASYVGGSGTNTLTYAYTVAQGQSTADLAVTAEALNGAAVRDLAGNAADLSGAVVNPPGTLVIAAPSTTVTSVAATSPGGTDLDAGQVVTFTVATSEPVTVSDPADTDLMLNVTGSGGTAETASYVGGSGSADLTFSYTVQAGDNAADLQVQSLTLDGGNLAVPGILAVSAATPYAAGAGPYSVTTADVNGDGKPDLVVADLSGGVDVLLGDGSGGFSAATSYAAGFNPASATTADVNGDGKLDLVVAGRGGGVDVLLGDGAGGFSAATSYAAGMNPLSVTAADVNGDGKPDLVVADLSGGVDVLLGDGAGSFSTATSYAAGSAPYSVTTADVNGDGKLDIVVADQSANDVSGGVDVLLGNGAGGFSAATSYAAGTSALSVTTADVNGDGRPDLVVAVNNDGVDVLLGNGAGGFSAATSYATGQYPISVTTADVNGDGKLDLVVADAGGAVDVLLGNGFGSFSAATSYAAGTNPVSVTTADVNGDGKLDLVVADYQGGVDVLLNGSTASSTFVPASAGTASGANSSIQIDTTAPAAPSTPADASVVNGYVDATNDTAAQTVTGTTEVGSSVEIFNNGAALGAAAVDGSGNYSYTLGQLADGSYNLTAQATDPAGNIGTASAGLAFTVDTVAPAAPSTPADASVVNGYVDATNDTATQTVTGTTEVGSSVEIFNNGAALGAAAVDGSGNYSYTLGQLADGSYSVTAQATDQAGNVGAASAGLAFTVDTVAPAAPSTPADASVVNGYVDAANDSATQAVTGTAEVGSSVEIFNNGASLGAAMVDGSGNYSYTLGQLADGSYSVTAQATDPAGNVGAASAPLAVTVDTKAPTVTGVTASPANGTFGAGAVVTFDVALSEIVSVSGGVPTLTLNDGGTASYVGGSGTSTLTYSYTAARGESTADLAVTAEALNGAAVQDLAGNAADLSGAVANPPGTLAITTPPVTVTSIAATSPGGTDLDAGKIVTFTVATSQPVTVSDSAETDLVLNVTGPGGMTETASYVGGSGTSSLTFSYTVAQGDNTPDLKVQSLTLDGGNLAVPGIPAFSAATSYAAGAQPFAVTTADVNGDGAPDLVVADQYGGVDVLLGNGAGSFSAATTYAAGARPSAVTTADVNGDGKPDLVVSDNRGFVDVLLGNGAGSFSAATTYAAGAVPLSVTTADVNGDGTPDLLVADYGQGSYGGSGVDVLLGNGAGSFSAATSYYAAGDTTLSVTTADVNGDGLLDIITVNGSGGVDVLLGDGAGSFSAATSYATGANPNSVTTADVNGDGTPDLVVADFNGGVDVLLGDGAGNFSTATSYAAGSGPVSVTTADVNGDGKLDIVVADFNGGVDVLLGNGTGGFSAATSYTAGSRPYSVTTADVNGDGKPDLVVADGNGGVDVLLNGSAASGTFDPASAGTAPGGNTGIQIDTTAPTITAEAASPKSTNLAAGQVVTFTIDTSEAVTATGSSLTLSNGATATYSSGNGTAINLLTYSYTVAAGDTNTADLQATALTGTIKDGAGNALNDASFTPIDSQDQLDPAAPTIAQTAEGPGKTPAIIGTGKAGAVVNLTIDGTLQTPAQPITVTADGSWSYTPTAPLPVGQNTATATQTKTGATSSVSNTDTFVVDPPPTPVVPAVVVAPATPGMATAPAVVTAPATANVATAPDSIVVNPSVTYANGAFTFTGTVSSAVGVKGVEFTALIDGQSNRPVDLGAATINPNGTFTYTDSAGDGLQGFIVATETDTAGVQTKAGSSFAVQGGSAPRSDRYAGTPSDPTYMGSTYYNADGSDRVTVAAPGETLASNFFDTYQNEGSPETTFVFDPGHGLDVVDLFRPGGTDHDTLSFKGSDFGTTAASELATVLQNTHAVKSGVEIIDPTSHDTVKLIGVTKAELTRNPADFAFHA